MRPDAAAGMNLPGVAQSWRFTLSRVIGEVIVAGVCLYAMDGLAHLRFRPGTFVIAWACLVFGIVTREFVSVQGWRFAAGIAVAMALAEVGRRVVPLSVSPLQLLYLVLLVELAAGLYRALVDRVVGAEMGSSTAECWRVLFAIVTGCVLAWPFMTDHLMGGTDARWYGYVMTDFLTQERAGVFPIYTGQTEFQFNGAIHPIRTAPLHFWIAGVLDLISLRALSPLAVQHLTVVLSSLGASLGMYCSLAAMNPKRSWAALLVAVLYACCPAQLAAIYSAEAYMTFMAFPWIVLVLYGTMRSFDRADRVGWWCLSLGLAFTWLAHPSVGVWVTIVVAALQLVWLAVNGRTFAEILKMSAAGVAFVSLTAYYFTSMSETMRPEPGGAARVVMPASALAALVCGIWYCAKNRLRWGVPLALGGVATLWCLRTSWGVYGAAVVVLYAAVSVACRFGMRTGGSERQAEGVFLTLGAAGFLAPVFTGTDFVGKITSTNESLSVARAALRALLPPVSKDAVSVGGFQPGWAVLFLAVLALAGGLVSRQPRMRTWMLATAALVLVYIPWTGFGEFFWGNLPSEVVGVTSIAFDRRMLPAIIPLVAFGGFGGWMALRSNGLQRCVGLLLIAMLPWSAWEAAKFVRRGFAIRGPWTATKNFYRTETAPLSRFAYDLMEIPPYLSHGVLDYRFETRVLENDFSVRFGPDEYGRLMETPESRVLSLTSKPSEPNSPWLILSPLLEVAPGEDWTLRCEFAPGVPPGIFVLPSVAGPYREYALPNSGYGKTFGSAPGSHGILTLRNSGSVLDQYHWEFVRAADFAPHAGEGEFARVIMSRLDPSRLPVRITSLMPYRATVELARGGWLETFRSWLPGYEATINGAPAPVRESPQHLVMVQVPAGTSGVEVRFKGTAALRASWWVSASGMAAMLVSGCWLAKDARRRHPQ